MKHIKSYASVFFYLMMMVLFSTCRHSLHPLAQLSLPQWPPATQNIHHWPDLESWQVQVTTPKYTTVYTIPATQQAIFLPLNENTPVAVQIYPITQGISFFRPAGAVLPWDAELSWQQGFTCEILKKLYLSTETLNDSGDVKSFASSYNWSRFNSQLEKKSQTAGIFYNPWLLDQNQLLSKILSKSFTATSLNLKKCSQVQLDSVTLSSYIPQNYNNPENLYTLQENSLEKFLYWNQEFYITTATLNSKGALSLAINSLPL